MLSGGKEVNLFGQICLILETKFDNMTLQKYFVLTTLHENKNEVDKIIKNSSFSSFYTTKIMVQINWSQYTYLLNS